MKFRQFMLNFIFSRKWKTKFHFIPTDGRRKWRENIEVVHVPTTFCSLSRLWYLLWVMTVQQTTDYLFAAVPLSRLTFLDRPCTCMDRPGFIPVRGVRISEVLQKYVKNDESIRDIKKCWLFLKGKNCHQYVNHSGNLFENIFGQ